MTGGLEAEGIALQDAVRGQQRGEGQGKGTARGRPGQRQVYPLCGQEGAWSPLSTPPRRRRLFLLHGDLMAAVLRCPWDEPQPSGASGILWLMGLMSNLINRNMPDFRSVTIWTETRLELTYELSMKTEFLHESRM